MSPLIPEKPILVSPSLASTIGLEEAVLLSLLDDITHHRPGNKSRGYLWYELSGEELNRQLPFWNDLDIQRISQRLRDLSIILLLSAPYRENHQLKFAFNQQVIQQFNHQNSTTPPPANNVQHSAKSVGASLISPHWQPDRETLIALSQLNIPEHFARERTPEFVRYWRERGESQHSWGSKFIHHVQRQWTHYVAQQQNNRQLPNDWQPSCELQQHIRQEGIPTTFVQKSLQCFSLYHKNSGASHSNWDMPFFSWLKEDWEKQDTPFIDRKSTAMSNDWRPDQHTLTYLSVSQGIEQSFIEECIPEFIHKWIEKKAIFSEWGSTFAKHIIEQWRFVQAGVNKNPNPKLISRQWKPSPDCLEILEIHSGIERSFIDQQIAEFILYWTNRAQPMHSWDNIFLRHVKHQWKQHYERQQPTAGASRTKDRSVAEQLSDRSWAS
ncbi:hypothetical protein AB835_04980 [Candidatus Endobugula sertula]|uniref:DnaT DNA-binding domain-containing protein n=1 Tax=Candidatus Endobugula sertula TaxID=62101 RepID=A0A1D2QRT0_9GAMM|nr:hypothetical protein AB835_04980 [Candidatus Endobugula sertula]